MQPRQFSQPVAWSQAARTGLEIGGNGTAPVYFLVILGVWKVLAAVAVLAPGLPRLKEWAYAGLVFNFTGAAASHLAVGDRADTLVAPMLFTGLTFASWALRPPARRDLAPR